jgi:RNA ligase (TIGR02306 family)
MSNWKVSKQRITLFPHPNAEKLELGKVGAYQVVVQKGLYADGDEVVFVPEKSVLTGVLRDEFANYLAGPNKDRVKAIALRGELSCGIILNPDLVARATGHHLNVLPVDEDLSERMGITKYEPPIPSNLAGEVAPLPDGVLHGTHDCEHLGIYEGELMPGEEVVITEKLHGSQAIYYMHPLKGQSYVASKGLLSRGLVLLQTADNAYWQAAPPIWYRIGKMHAQGMCGIDDAVQVFGELIPCQGGAWNYGQSSKTVRVFDVRVNGVSVPYDKLIGVWDDVWVPILFHGPYDPVTARSYRDDMEKVSGKALHIREGAVVRPYIDRRASDGTRLALKVINPKYKETGEEIN